MEIDGYPEREMKEREMEAEMEVWQLMHIQEEYYFRI